jgi:hypothetical protein
MNFKKINQMKTMIAMAIATVLSLSAIGQNKALKGSGNLMELNYNFKNFDKVKLEDMDGTVTIEIGKSFGINVVIDDNLFKMLSIQNKNGMLTLALLNNENNRLYVENTNIKIRIQMPEISVFENNSNANALIKGIVGRYLRIENNGNGNTTADGTIDELDIIKKDNGDVKTDQLIAKTAKVEAEGNGNVLLNVNEQLKIKLSGNGNAINNGKAAFTVLSKSGNGELIKN